MKVAAIQFTVTVNQAEQNRQRAAQLLTQAADAGARLAVLPELWPTGFALEHLPTQAETMRGASISLLRQLAREREMFIVGGSIAEKKDGKYYNTSVAVSPAGEIVAKYRKAHLYPHGVGESRYFSPGDEWVVSEYHDLHLGLMLCYDVYFPEFARNLALRGATLLSEPALVREGLDQFHLLARARALENQCFLIFANQAGEQGAGHSLIVSPLGKVLAEAGAEDMVLTAELDLQELANLRTHRNALNERRNILDEIDNSQL